MKIAFLIRPDNHPASRYRVEQYIPFLEENNVNTRLIAFPKSTFAWFKLIKELNGTDIVFVQKKKIKNFWLTRIKRAGAKIIYDVDDAIMFNSPRHESPDSPVRMRRYIKMVENCDAIITGNSYLKFITEEYTPQISILSLSMDMKKYKLKPYKSDDELRKNSDNQNNQIILGWIGGTKSLFFVEKLMPVLENLAEQFPNLALKIVCDKFPESSKITIIKKQWKEEDEADDIQSFDIGISILTDDPWSKGKCGTKLLQYMAVGVPAIASPVGVHNEIIEEGVNGFLAKSDEEWSEKISLLVKDSILRKTIGLTGREIVKENYSLDVNAPKLLEILKSV